MSEKDLLFLDCGEGDISVRVKDKFVWVDRHGSVQGDPEAVEALNRMKNPTESVQDYVRRMAGMQRAR